MHYTYNLILKKKWKDMYVLCTQDGKEVFDIRAFNDEEAYIEAVRFMSSWPSVNIELERKNEK